LKLAYRLRSLFSLSPLCLCGFLSSLLTNGLRRESNPLVISPRSNLESNENSSRFPAARCYQQLRNPSFLTTKTQRAQRYKLKILCALCVFVVYSMFFLNFTQRLHGDETGRTERRQLSAVATIKDRFSNQLCRDRCEQYAVSIVSRCEDKSLY